MHKVLALQIKHLKRLKIYVNTSNYPRHDKIQEIFVPNHQKLQCPRVLKAVLLSSPPNKLDQLNLSINPSMK